MKCTECYVIHREKCTHDGCLFDDKENLKLKVGDTFWEYNRMLNAGYKRIAHTDEHIKYFLAGYSKRAFFTKEELLEAHPDASVSDKVKDRKISYACLD